MLRLHMMNEAERYKKIKQYCDEAKIKQLKKIFNDCLDKHNNKIEYCQDHRYKLEKIYNFCLKFN